MYKDKKLIVPFLLPAISLILLFIYYPIIQNFIYSFFRWSAFSQDKVFVGIAHYTRLFGDSVFLIALRNNVLYAIGSIVFQVGFGLIIASILEEKFMRKMQTYFRTIFFLPAVISITVAGLLWQLMYNQEIGLINEFLRLVGLESLTRAWLGDKGTAMYSIIIMSQWQYTGYIILLYLVAIKKIPLELYESAKIDGANGIRRFIHITIPQVKEMTLVTITITIIGAFKVFDEVYVMTGGGPGRSTEVLSTFMYRSGFRNDEMGYATAIATVIFVITFALTIIEFKLSGTKNKGGI